MGVFDTHAPLRVTKRPTHSRYSRSRDYDVEKHRYETDSDDGSEYSSDDSSLVSSRETSGSYSSNRPMLPRKSSAGSQRPPLRSSYKLPNRVVRYLCLGLISTIIIFMISLVRMSVVSSRRVDSGGMRKRPPPPPAPWESFPFLTRYYGGLRTLVPFEENKPEYPLPEDEPSNRTTMENIIPTRDIPASKPFEAYSKHSSKSYLKEYAPVKECFLDTASTIRIPRLQYYHGRPSGFPDAVIGSYELLGFPEDICFERFGRLGAYGHGYSQKYGGTGTGQHGDMEGASAESEVDYRDVNWAEAQKRCHEANAERFKAKRAIIEPSTTYSILDEGKSAHGSQRKREEASTSDQILSNTTVPSKKLPRTAVVIRSYDDFEYREEDVLQLRAMISELSLGSGGEYDVHLLVQVKDEGKHAIWADHESYEEHLNASVPEEFRGITTLWTTTQMLMLYQGIYDTFARGPELPAHGSYRGLQMAMQHFAQKHQEYDFFWHWEIDIRYTGHYYNLFSQIEAWSRKQPRKLLWERNSRFYIPSVHGSWEDFKQMVRVQTEMGTKSPEEIWAGLPGVKTPSPAPKGENPIWGPERPQDPEDWFETENDPMPLTTPEKDKYQWGVGEDADLISFNPLFDPEGTTWLLADDYTGYNITEKPVPRRAAIVTSSRMSRRLLNTMHRETAFKKHHAFSEMWAPTAALHHGYKAVYVPHPMYVDREWPTAYLAGVMNAGRNGATGGSKSSVFGEKEHNFLGMTWYYNAGFAPNLWKRWLGLSVNNEGGEEFETIVDEGRDGKGVNGMRGGEGRMCLPPMLIHPVKDVELPVGSPLNQLEVPESDPAA
ncbi:hypothetical protein BJ875DRAFT_96918 [Amylocarpus encephaloides]|uniref:Major facilitator superfamily transporter n=1 Tax=Amylocarpus encephaloides TaxID=45428 RepID=A0A9P8C327_9HELO|nr:hypothetical protein BJ875DRAFT_96918 [Amylocarpus encephaloides]